MQTVLEQRRRCDQQWLQRGAYGAAACAASFSELMAMCRRAPAVCRVFATKKLGAQLFSLMHATQALELLGERRRGVLKANITLPRCPRLSLPIDRP